MEEEAQTDRPADDRSEKHTAGAFDIRFIIAGLIGIYGVILVLLGIFAASDAELEKADGFNVNLWGGLGMVVVALAFVAWGRLRPVVVPPSVESGEDAQ